MLYVSQQWQALLSDSQLCNCFFKLERVWKQWAGLGHAVEVKEEEEEEEEKEEVEEEEEKDEKQRAEQGKRKGWVLMINV